MSDDAVRPADITVKRDEHVAIEFGDGRTFTYGLAELRQHCPCAHCRGRRDQGQLPWDPAHIDELRITDAELTGGWGIRLEWQDGHGTGIYPWEHLRAWGEQGEAPFGADSGLGS
ncbi:MAG: DUF971 domain-containing protein [Actinomycetota bacterium]|nr:DUF971 domain-containing protein [Actinomycetota bacterium]